MNGVALLFIVVFAASTISISWAAPLCEDDPTLNTLQLNECLLAKYKIDDAKLNTIYKQVFKEISQSAKESEASATEAKESLVKAQRAWVQFRDSECDARYTYFMEGSIRNSASLECKIELTNDRIKTLQWWQDILAH